MKHLVKPKTLFMEGIVIHNETGYMIYDNRLTHIGGVFKYTTLGLSVSLP